MIPDSRKLSVSGRKLDLLEADIKALKIEFDRFFNGALPVPPEPQLARVERRLRSLRGQQFRATADRFRLSGLETRFNVLCELWRRRIREREQAAQRAAVRDSTAEASGLDPFGGIQIAEDNRAQAVEALYTELYRASGREKKVDLQTFQGYLDRQISRLRSRTGCRDVQFRIANENGELKLKAKPIVEQPRKGGSA